MNCNDIQPLLSAYADRELSADEFRNVSRHLTGCKACETKAAMIQNMKSAVSGQPRASLPLDLRMAIQAETVGAARTQGKFRISWLIPTLVFAAAAGSGLIYQFTKAQPHHEPAGLMVQQPVASPAPNQIAWHRPDVSTTTLQ
jgi:anti-sigma factor RsiW